MTLDDLFSILNTVLPNKVFYGVNTYDNDDNAEMPYIVYQEISKRPIGYIDDKPIYYRSNIQITLVTKTKSRELENTLETLLLTNDLVYQVISEFKNNDKSLNRIYEITMEEF